MRKTTPIHIGKNYQRVLKDLNRSTRVPQRYLVEQALDKYLEENHPNHYDYLKKKELESQKDNDDEEIE